MKQGFAYYNVDTDRYQDIRIKRLKREFSGNGIAVYDYILCEIYRVRGCCLEWDESTAFEVADYFGLKESLVMEIVNYCCNVGLFDKELRASGSVLTSQSIQRRFIEMCKRAKRSDAKIPEEIRLLPEEPPKIPEEILKPQEEIDKVEKSKEDKSKETPPCLLAETPPPGGAEGGGYKTISPMVVDVRLCRVSGGEWRESFEAYLSGLRQCYEVLRKDAAWLAERKELNPRVDVLLSLKKACVEYWATEKAWKKQKAKKVQYIDWRQTLATAISQPQNKVYDNGTKTNQTKQGAVSDSYREEVLRGIGAI